MDAARGTAARPIPPPSRRALAAAAVGAALLATACAAPAPGIGARDSRVAVDAGAAPWRSLGLVATDAGGRCTGALVGPRTVLTAAHCLFSPRTARPVDPRSVVFILSPETGGRHAGGARAASFVLGPGFAVAPGVRPDPAAPPDADWAVLLLGAPLGGPGTALPLAAGLAPPGTPLAFGGYQADRALQMVADLGCTVTGYARDGGGRVMMRHSCTATRGASGGPLLARGPGDAWVVAGVGSLAEGGAAGGWAVPTAAIARVVLEAAAKTGPGAPATAEAPAAAR